MKQLAVARQGEALDTAIVSSKGAHRWAQGHPWIYRSDVLSSPDTQPGAVVVRDQRGRELGCALWSPTSEIALRLLDRNAHASLDEGWWSERIGALSPDVHRSRPPPTRIDSCMAKASLSFLDLRSLRSMARCAADERRTRALS